MASDESSYITVGALVQVTGCQYCSHIYSKKGAEFNVDGGLSSCYVTPVGEPTLPAPVGLSARLS